MAKRVKKSSGIFQSGFGLALILFAVLAVGYFLYSEHQKGVLGTSTSYTCSNSTPHGSCPSGQICTLTHSEGTNEYSCIANPNVSKTLTATPRPKCGWWVEKISVFSHLRSNDTYTKADVLCQDQIIHKLTDSNGKTISAWGASAISWCKNFTKCKSSANPPLP